MVSLPVIMGFIGFPGWIEMLIVAAVVLLFFGNRLPSVMRSLGQGITEFRRGINEKDSDDTPQRTQSKP